MRFLFSSGTARGGTNFRTFILDRHPRVSMAIDPFIPIFRAYRDSLVRSIGKQEALIATAAGALDDYYYSDVKLQVMDAIQDADPDLPFDRDAWPELRVALQARMTLTSANMLDGIDRIPAPTFREVFENCMALVAERKSGPLEWVGFNENWAAEFFGPLSRLFPDAKFILHLRDPRAVINSSEFAEPDFRKRPTVLSFARHLRKYNALSQRLPAMPSLQSRLLITHYESFFAAPAAQLRRMTDFLELEVEPGMLDVTSFRRGDGRSPETSWGVYADSAHNWRETMPAEMMELVEFVCSPDMALHGHELVHPGAAHRLSKAAFAYALKNSRECLGWRTDFPEIEHTLGCEMFRKQMIAVPDAAYSEDEVRRSFLYPEVFRAVCRAF